MKNFKFFSNKPSKNTELVELSDSKLENVVGGVSFTASIAVACKRCKYKYKATLAGSSSLT